MITVKVLFILNIKQRRKDSLKVKLKLKDLAFFYSHDEEDQEN